MKHLTSTLILVWLALAAVAAKVDTISVPSPCMSKQIKAVVICPEGAAQTAVPTVYLLHGYGGCYSDWIRQVPTLTYWADLLGLMIVCPDGNIGSWYFDSPIDPTYRYETHMVQELVPYIDQHYPTLQGRKARGITGLSMGGHGALYLAIRHQDVFGAAGSMSGGVDFRPFRNNWDIAKRLGNYDTHKENWEKNTVINLIPQLSPGALALIVDCGMDDFFLEVNQNLHQQLVAAGIPHDFILRPGKHNWPYWTNAVPYQLLYMARYFGLGATSSTK